MQCVMMSRSGRCPNEAEFLVLDDTDPKWRSYRCQKHTDEYIGHPLNKGLRHAEPLIEAVSA